MASRTRVALPGLIPGDRIRRRHIDRPPAALVQRFVALDDLAGLVSRVLDRLGVAGAIPAHELVPLAPGQRVVGPAITVRNVPARLVPHHAWRQRHASRMAEREAYFVAAPGDVIVIDGGGRMAASNMGGHSAKAALDRGCAGTIVDGPVTGVSAIRAAGYPVWSRGATTITGNHRVETIEINGVISCAGVQVCPGDLVVADDQGVAIVPADLAERVWRLCSEQLRAISRLTRSHRPHSPEFARRFMRSVAGGR
jgi:4-hydroxy-4-methyl-2-oxoglutarate aldolase